MGDFAAEQLQYEIEMKCFAAESGKLPQTVCCVRLCRRARKCHAFRYKDSDLLCIENIEAEQQDMFAEMARTLDTAPEIRYVWLAKAEKASTPQELILREVELEAILTRLNARARRSFRRHAAASFARTLAPPPPSRLSSAENDQPRIDACPEPVQPTEPFCQPSLRVL